MSAHREGRLLERWPQIETGPFLGVHWVTWWPGGSLSLGISSKINSTNGYRESQSNFGNWLNDKALSGSHVHSMMKLESTLFSPHSWVPVSFLPLAYFNFFSIFAFISVVTILYLTVSFCKLTFPSWPGSLYFRLWGYIWNKSKIMGLVWLEESILTPACGFLRPDQREVRWGEEFVWI